MTIETKIRGYILDNLDYVLKNSRETNPTLVVDAFCRMGGVSDDLADIMRENFKGWGDEIVIGEEGLLGKIEQIDAARDIRLFTKIVNHSLCRYALRVLVDGEDEVSRLMQEYAA